VRQLEITPKAFANFSPGFKRSENPGETTQEIKLNPEKGSPTTEPFQGINLNSKSFPGFSLRSNPGLKLANAFGVFIKSQTDAVPE